MTVRTGSPRRRRRLAVVTAFAALLGLVLAGCSVPPDDDAAAGGKVTLRFLSYNYGTPCCSAGIQQLIDRFEATNPDVDVQPEPVAVADVLTKLRSETAAGAAPDVAQLGWSKAAEARSSLPLVPVQDIPPAPEWASASSGFYPNVLDAVRNPATGRVDIMPFSMSVPILYYNADLFRKAGLDPARPPTTMAEVKTAAAAVRRTGAQGVYVGLADSGKSDYLTQSVMNSAGGGVVDAAGRVTLDSPASVRAVDTVRDLTVSGVQPGVKSDDAQAAFAAGGVGMLVFTTAAMATTEKAAGGKFDLRTAAFPSIDGSPPRPTYSGAGLAVFTQDQRKQQAAWRFVNFLTGDEGFTILTKTIGYLPLRPAVVTDPRYLRDYFARNGHLLPSLRQIGQVRPYTYFTGDRASEAVTVLQTEAIEPIVLQGRETAPTLQQAAAKIRSLLG